MSTLEILSRRDQDTEENDQTKRKQPEHPQKPEKHRDQVEVHLMGF